MKLASWNVNSVRARLDRVLEWLKTRQPDVACLQELKTEEKAFPREAFRELGYQTAAVFQASYNGVAILSRYPLSQITAGLDDGEDDPQARMVAATVAGVRVISVYVPNGQSVGSAKFAYKLRWMERLTAYLRLHHSPEQALVVCGDFNVAPEARDVYDPPRWEAETLFHPQARAALQSVADFGLVDTLRIHHPEPGLYSWWDYRELCFPKNRGLRIDHILATRSLADRCTETAIDRDARKGKQPSDHAPCLATFAVEVPDRLPVPAPDESAGASQGSQRVLAPG